MSTVKNRLLELQARIAAAAQRSGRDASAVELVAVSKYQPASKIRAIMDEISGLALFGESRVQEAAAKIPLLPAKLHWHFIGHLQSNKIRKALPLFELFHSVTKVFAKGRLRTTCYGRDFFIAESFS